MSFRSVFKRYVEHEATQLEVNTNAGYLDYAGTCFHSHQYAEKALKAKLSEFGLENDKTHNLCFLFKDMARLVDLSPESSEYIELMADAVQLNDVYTVSRYPVDSKRDCDLSNAIDSVQWSDAIVDWVTRLEKPRDKEGKHALKHRIQSVHIDRASRKRPQSN